MIKLIIKFFILITAALLINTSYADITFENIKDKKVSYLDFFLLKLENKLISRSSYLRRQLFATRVQYSHISTEVNFEENNIVIKIYTIMDKKRYSKKRYKIKLKDCNQVRNLIFYRKHGYKFFTQKRDPAFTQEIMEEIFIKVFFDNMSFEDDEIKFLLDKMLVKVTIFNPIKKQELNCFGKINQYELN